MIQSLGKNLTKSLTVVELGIPSGGLDVFLRELGWKYGIGSFQNDFGESLNVQWDLLAGRVELTQITQGFRFPIAGHFGWTRLGPRKCLALGPQTISTRSQFFGVGRGDYGGPGSGSAGWHPESPLNQFELSPDLPVDLRAAAVSRFTPPWRRPSLGSFKQVPVTVCSRLGYPSIHDSMSDSLPAAGPSRR